MKVRQKRYQRRVSERAEFCKSLINMAEREGFEAQLTDSQDVISKQVVKLGAGDGTQNGTQGAVEDYSTLARIVETWPRLNTNLKAAIAAIVASQEKAVNPNEPEMGGI